MALTKVDGEGVGTLDSLNITESNNGATEGPSFELHRNSASPADNDVLGALLYTGKSSTGADKTYSSMNGFISNVANANASGGLIFNTRNSDTLAERMRVDSSGNVGINNSSPGSYYSNSNQLVVGSGSARQGITIASSTSTIGQLAFADGTSGDARFEGWVLYDHNTNHMSLGTSADERMRIDSAGAIRLANTSMNIDNSGNTATGLSVQSTGVTHIATSGNNTSLVIQRVSDTGTDNAIFFMYGSSGVGSVQVTSSSTAYNTSSDYRLKTAVTYDWDATTRLKQLRPARFKWIVDGDDAVPVDGFLAHEAAVVCPESVTGTKDEVEVWKDGEELPDGVSVGDNKLDDDGNTIPLMQGIDQSKLVPLLCKTILELEARITALETA